jgi:hypothetical protein
MSQLAPDPKAPETLVQDLRQLITDGRRHAASVVNSTLTLLYWRVGDRIRRDVLQNERARYGEQILATLSQELIAEIGRGFDATNLTRIMKFAESFPGNLRPFGVYVIRRARRSAGPPACIRQDFAAVLPHKLSKNCKTLGTAAATPLA